MHTDTSDASAKLSSEPEPHVSERSSHKLVLVGVAVVLLALILAASLLMLRNPSTTATLRDIVIVWIAIEALVIGGALIALAIQLAKLTSLLRHEIKPILENTGDAINVLRGTARFVSDNISTPVVKVSGAVAGIQRFLGLFSSSWLGRQKRR